MPPTIGGKNWPYDSGQSGTARLDPVLVTRPPMKINTNVEAAVISEKRCRPAKKTVAEEVSGNRFVTTAGPRVRNTA